MMVNQNRKWIKSAQKYTVFCEIPSKYLKASLKFFYAVFDGFRPAKLQATVESGRSGMKGSRPALNQP